MSAPKLRQRISEGDGDPRHGTVNGYGNLDCRCPACTDAWRADYAERRRLPRTLAPDDDRHGTPNGYGYWHCRCRRCTDAHNVGKVEQAARRRARA